MLNATLSFKPGRVILTGPTSAETIAKPERVVQGLSKEFASAGSCSAGGDARVEGCDFICDSLWSCRGQLARALAAEHRVRAAKSLSLASVAAKTESDKLALDLLKSEFTNLGDWDSHAQATSSLNAEKSIDPTCSAERSAAREDLRVWQFSECDAGGRRVRGQYQLPLNPGVFLLRTLGSARIGSLLRWWR
jgi:hypothetical protein